MGKIRIIKAGLSSTIQDQGRLGYRSRGISVSGAMDRIGARLANMLVGNAPQEACIEMTLLGDTFVFSEDTIIAICGGDFSFKINGKPIGINTSIPVVKGDILTSEFALAGCRAYLALRGGLKTRVVLSSRSTSVRESLGHFGGRKLRAGDELPYTPCSASFTKQKVPADLLDRLYKPRPIRFTYGAKAKRFSDLSKGVFTESDYKIGQSSDRMGYRLSGGFIHAQGGHDIISGAVNFGSIQVPGNGQPIIMMADCQTVGGYVKIGQVIQADLPYLAQCKPGDTLKFQVVSVDEAIGQWRDLHSQIEDWSREISASFREDEKDFEQKKYFEIAIDGNLYNVRVSDKI